MSEASRKTYLRLTVVIFLWAANWLVMKQGLMYMSPLFFAAARLAGAAIIMFATSLVAGEALLPKAGERLRLAVVGIFQVGGMVGLSSLGLLYVQPGRAAVLVYTLQLWVLPLGWLIAGERINRKGLFGALLGFCGIALFMNPALINWHNSRVMWGNALMLASGFSWALGACLYRRHRWSSSYWTQTWWQVLSSAVLFVIVLFAVPAPQHWTLNAVSISVLVYNWIFCTALCFWWWGKTLSVLPASVAGQLMTIVPILAVLMSAAIMGEHITVPVVISMLLIVTGICVTVASRTPVQARQSVRAVSD